MRKEIGVIQVSGMGFVGGRFEEVGIWFGESEVRGKDILGKKKKMCEKTFQPGRNQYSFTIC